MTLPIYGRRVNNDLLTKVMNRLFLLTILLFSITILVGISQATELDAIDDGSEYNDPDGDSFNPDAFFEDNESASNNDDGI